MGTIITQYNPWREQLAVNLLGGLLKDVIQRNQQKADNRIQNRALADLASITQPVTTNYLGTQNQPQGLTDGWTSAFRKGGNELANFDINTAEIAPQMAQQSQVQYYNPAQMINSFFNILGSNKDYQALNTEQLMKLAAPYFAASEKMRQEYNTKQIADKFMGAKTYEEKLNELTSGLINSAISSDIYKNAVDSNFNVYKHKNLSAQQQFDNSYKDRVLAQDIYRWNKNFVEGQRQFDINNELEQKRLVNQNNQFYSSLGARQEEARQLREDTMWSQPVLGRDGYYYQYDRNGNIRRIDIQAPLQTQNGNQKNSTWGRREEQQIKDIDTKLEALKEKEAQLNEDLKTKNYDSDEVRIQFEKDLYETKRQIQELTNLRNNLVWGTGENLRNNQSSTQETAQPNNQVKRGKTLAAEMVGEQFAKVSNNGEYLNKNPNRKHPHQGTDYLAPKDTPIRVPYSLGGQWTITAVQADPGKSNLGVHVVMQKNINGKNYKIVTGHMAAGSLKVKPGDVVNPGTIIGLSGNTGQARGINGGYHLHLGTLIDGKNVDPEKFFDLIGNNNNQQQPNNNTQQTTQTQQDNSPVLFRDENGKTITQNQYDEMLQQVQAGKSPIVRSKEDLDKQLENRGFKKFDTQSTQNTSSLSVPDEPSFTENPNITFNPQSSKSLDLNPVSVDNSPTIFTNDNGEKITQNQYDKLLQQFKDKTELEMFLWNKGFRRFIGTPKPSTILGNNPFNQQIDFLNGYNRG